MKVKKILAFLLAILVLAAVFAGCSSKDTGGERKESSSSSDKSVPADDSSADDSSSAAEEIVTVKVSYPCLVIVPSDEATVGVEEAINKHLEEKGSRIRLDLEPIDGNSYTTTMDMKQISGEEVDLYMALVDLSTQVNANKLQPITPYIDTVLKPTIDIMGEHVLQATTFNGEVYAVPCYKTVSLTYYLILDSEIAENDLGLKEGDTLTIDGVTDALKTLHEKYPDKIAMAVRPGANGAANNFCLSAMYGTAEYFKVVGITSSVGIVGDDTTVVNLYDTDYFRTVCRTAYEWNKAGYVNKDASVVTEEGYDLLKAGRALSYLIGYGGYNPRITDDATDSTHGRSVLYVPVTSTMNTPSGLDWGVAQSCKNPEAACEALNLFYTDAFVMNYLLCGLEGRDWVDTGLGSSPEDKVVTFPEGMDAFSVPYYAYFTCGIMGNEYLDWIYVGADGKVEDNRAKNKEFMEKAVVSPIYGFTLNTEKVKSALAAISNVETQYLGGLLTGELDPDVYIPKLNQELENAGINEVIQEAQAQLDAWKADK